MHGCFLNWILVCLVAFSTGNPRYLYVTSPRTFWSYLASQCWFVHVPILVIAGPAGPPVPCSHPVSPSFLPSQARDHHLSPRRSLYVLLGISILFLFSIHFWPNCSPSMLHLFLPQIEPWHSLHIIAGMLIVATPFRNIFPCVLPNWHLRFLHLCWNDLSITASTVSSSYCLFDSSFPSLIGLLCYVLIWMLPVSPSVYLRLSLPSLPFHLQLLPCTAFRAVHVIIACAYTCLCSTIVRCNMVCPINFARKVRLGAGRHCLFRANISHARTSIPGIFVCKLLTYAAGLAYTPVLHRATILCSRFV